jgi:M6 family metalloprotease-like protein
LLVAAVLVAAGTTGMSSPFGAAAGGAPAFPPNRSRGDRRQERARRRGAAGGVLRAALLLVHASDMPPDAVPIARGTFDAAAAWFRTVSYGRLDLRVEPTPRRLALPASSSAYAASSERYLRDAVAAADPYVDFSQFDVVYLAPATHTPETIPTSASLNGFGVRADGKEIRLWIPWGADFAAKAGAPGHLVHETGHLLGLPDLYATGALTTYHRWDVMAARWPAELLAWHR